MEEYYVKSIFLNEKLIEFAKICIEKGTSYQKEYEILKIEK
jgi:hypothetical protein